jgi:hypothetical protein
MSSPQATLSTPQALPPRADLYAGIHKALRAWMFDVLMTVGRCDAGDPAALMQTLGKVEALLTACGQHLLHENEFIHPALGRAGRQASAQAHNDHEGHLREIAHLRATVCRVQASQGMARGQALMVLYRELALFVADNLRHMHMEETAHNEALWATHTDTELHTLHDRLVQSIPAQEMAVTLGWMLPSVSHAERVEMLHDMRSKMPPPAFEGVVQLARASLSIHDFAALCRSLGIQVCLP